MGDLGGDDLGGDDLGGDDLGGDDLGGDDLGGDEPADGDLLAAPARRDDDVRTYEKGTYLPVKHDKRALGANKRSMHGQWSNEKGKNTPRNTFGAGALDIMNLTKGGVYEEGNDTYRTEEDKVFEVKERNSEIKLLIEQLEQREDEKKDEKQEEQT